MNVWLRAVGIGFVAGLRSMTAPALVARAAHDRKLRLRSTPLRFMRSERTAEILTGLAALEFVGDVLPFTPARTELPGLATRAVTGGFSAACIAIAEDENPLLASSLGAAAAIAGAFAGYQARTRLGKMLDVPDYPLAVSEDLLAIGLGSLLLRR